MKSLKDYIGLIALSVGLVSSIAVSQYQVGELKAKVEKLEAERDAVIRLEVKVEELVVKSNEAKKQNEDTYKLVYDMYANR